VLALHNGQQLPQWPLGITLNTFLALFASITKAMLLLPVSEGLGQLRWLRFSGRPRRLADFELIDEARRTAMANLKLLFLFKGGWVQTLRVCHCLDAADSM
jgi:Protein of unknown function (DUF3176)